MRCVFAIGSLRLSMDKEKLYEFVMMALIASFVSVKNSRT